MQRAVGRSLAATTAAHEVFVIETADGWRQIVFGDDGTERLVPYEMDKEHSYGR
ncbi:hypothetical protein [Streptomyces albogriseolus]|uniref:hypothetical protein n=1 Tax=Streptomyces albogriseolus TaxID=1887 RepID=UPI00345FBA0E